MNATYTNYTHYESDGNDSDVFCEGVFELSPDVTFKSKLVCISRSQIFRHFNFLLSDILFVLTFLFSIFSA